MIGSCYRDCQYKYFHKFNYECVHDIKLANITNNEICNLTISGKNMNSYDLNKKLKDARQNGFIFNQINKLTIKFYSSLRYINMLLSEISNTDVS